MHRIDAELRADRREDRRHQDQRRDAFEQHADAEQEQR